MSFSSPTGGVPEIASRACRFYCDLVPPDSPQTVSLPPGTQGTISCISVCWNTESTFYVSVTVNGIEVFAAQITGTPTFVQGVEPFYIYDLPIFVDDVIIVNASSAADPLGFANAYVTIWGRLYGADL